MRPLNKNDIRNRACGTGKHCKCVDLKPLCGAVQWRNKNVRRLFLHADCPKMAGRECEHCRLYKEIKRIDNEAFGEILEQKSITKSPKSITKKGGCDE